jgi:hypothetical protein
MLAKTFMRIRFAAPVFLLATTLPAALLSHDSAFGGGTITFDTATDLRWLDVNLTANISFTDMQSRLLPGGQFEGYRHASYAELLTLATSAGVPDPQNGMEANFMPINDLADLLGGFLAVHGDVNGSRLALAGWIDPGALAQLSISTVIANGGAVFTFGDIQGPMAYDPSTSQAEIGHYLVAIPEPSTLALTALGLLALFRRDAIMNAWSPKPVSMKPTNKS